MIEWKTVWITAITAVSSTLVTLTITLDSTTLALISSGISVVIAVGVFLVSPSLFEAADMFRGVSARANRIVQRWSTTAASVYAAWTITTVWIQYDLINLIISGIALAAVTVSTYFAARAIEWKIARIKKAETSTNTPELEHKLDRNERRLHAALKRAGRGYIKIRGNERLDNDAGRQFTVQVPSYRQQSEDSDNRKSDDLPASAAEGIAIGLSEVLGCYIPTNQVHIRAEPKIGAGIHTITVLDYDVMGDVIPYVDNPQPSTITEPKIVGYDSGGQPHYERLDQHTRNVGSTRSGKSSEMHVEFAELTRCTNALIWVAGVQKLYDLVAGWVEPYIDTGMPCPIDWIGNGIDDTLEVMASAMQVARWRQRQPMSQRKWRTIVVFLDEFSFTADCRNIRIAFDGRDCNATELASMLLKGAASANVFVKLASQRDVTDHFGDKGGDVIGNVACNYAFANNDQGSIGRMTGDYKLPAPTNKGEYWIKSEAAGIKNLKAPYIQTTDPSQPKLHEGATISDISWSRRNLVTGGLTTAEGLEAAGDAYKQRRQTVDANMIAYLTSAPETLEPSLEDDPIYRETIAALDAMTTPTDVVDNLAENKKRPEMIADILNDASQPLSIGDITAQLIAAGDDVNNVTVGSTLSRMATTGRAVRVGEGIYGPVKQTVKR